MNEADWLASTRPGPMLRHLRRRASERKLRLFAFACWAPLRHLLLDPRLVPFLESLEVHADGRLVAPDAARRMGLEILTEDTQGLVPSPRAAREREFSVRLVLHGLHAEAGVTAVQAVRATRDAASWIGNWAVATEARTHSQLLREIFGNPFRPVAPGAAGLAAAVRQLGEAIYEEHRFGDLPVLADAAEEAGCTDADLLAHLRGPGPHTRGCWALDALLGRE